MQSNVVRRLVGKPVVDLYGRYVGLLLGYSVDSSGELASVGVDRGPEGFEEFEKGRFRVEEETIVVTPRWVTQSQEMGQNLASVHKRLAGLKHMAKEMGITTARVGRMVKKSDGKLHASLQSYKMLAERMALRGFEIESQTEDLDDFVESLTAQLNSGDLDRETYDAICDQCRAVKARNAREIGELSRTLKGLAKPGEVSVLEHLPQVERDAGLDPIQREFRFSQGVTQEERPRLVSEMP